MTRLYSRVLLIGWLVILATGAGLVRGQDKVTIKGNYDSTDYDESADANKQITDAVAKARKEGKEVLLQFGANSCLACLELHRFFMREKTVSTELAKDYVLLLVDVGRGHNQDILRRCGYPTLSGIPALSVLDAAGKLVTTQDVDELADGSSYDPEKVLAFLKKWASKRSE